MADSSFEPQRHEGTKSSQSSIRTVAVIGSGTMGSGIAQACASAGFEVQIFDVNTDLIKKALAQIDANLKQAVDKGRLTAEAKTETLRKIRPVSSLEAVKTDIIIEAIVEKIEPKQELFRQLEKLNPNAILASNTSTFPITQVASVLQKPENCIGLHFFNPAHIMKLVEIISGTTTKPEIVEQLKTFAKQLGKTPVVAKDSPGFIVNRVARHFYLESLKVLEEKVAPMETIDKLMRASGFKMGPFELMDLIGIDVNFAVTSSLYNAFHQEPKFRPSRIQQQMVDAGRLGKKTGRGFYDYNG